MMINVSIGDVERKKNSIGIQCDMFWLVFIEALAGAAAACRPSFSSVSIFPIVNKENVSTMIAPQLRNESNSMMIPRNI